MWGVLVSYLRRSRNKSAFSFRHYRESGNPVFLVFPGFRLALATASLAGMTTNFCCEFRRHHTSSGAWDLWGAVSLFGWAEKEAQKSRGEEHADEDTEGEIIAMGIVEKDTEKRRSTGGENAGQ
jgi:hypothetical protein